MADTSLPILLQGESGTGKDILAQLVHANSKRSRQPFIKVNCPAIPHSLIESELFGFERGAFTGAYATRRGRVELAHAGSLFLDDVGALEQSSQAKLLQVLQDGTFMRVGGQDVSKVDTRLICTASSDLKKQSEEGSFRLDFYFRISAVTIGLPPLQRRIADLPLLIDYFMRQHGRTFQVTPKPISREVMALMERYNWPGNIRQLENMIRSYVLMGDEEAMVADLVPPTSSGTIPEIDVTRPISLKRITKAATRELEREIILKVLRANGWSRKKAAKWLNISYRALLYKMQESELGVVERRPYEAAPSSSEPVPCEHGLSVVGT